MLQEIDAALALTEKATPGPWIWDGRDLWHQGESYEGANPHLYAGINKDERLAKSVSFQANTAFIAASRTLLPASLRCLKTAIEGLIEMTADACDNDGRGCQCVCFADSALTTICAQWEAGR